MKVSRGFAAVLSTAACVAMAQSYTWTDITPSNATVSNVATDVFEGNRLLITGVFQPGGAGTTYYPVLYSNDAGETWNLPAALLPLVNSAIFADVARPGVVYLTEHSTFGGILLGLPHEGHLYRSDDFGRTWSLRHTTRIGEIMDPFGTDPLEADGLYGAYRQSEIDYACPGFCVNTKSTGTARSPDGGFDWTSPLASPDGSYFAGPTPSAPTRLFIGVIGTGAFVSADAGATWSRADSTLSDPLTWIRPDPREANVLYGYRRQTENFRLLRSDDNGASWRDLFFSLSTDLNPTIDSARPNVLWVPYRDRMYRSEDRGNTWREVPYPFMSLPVNVSPTGTIVTSPAEPGVVYLVRYSRLFRGVPNSVPDPVIVEYQYEGNRYWLTSLDGEALSQDYRQQPGDVKRTGVRWGAWRSADAPRGAVGSCRFWPKPETGLRTRVLVQQGFECEIIRQGGAWILEAENEFYTVAVVNGACPAGTVAVRRFNNLRGDANHRWAADEATAQEMRARGWYDEGVRFCARPLGSNE